MFRIEMIVFCSPLETRCTFVDQKISRLISFSCFCDTLYTQYVFFLFLSVLSSFLPFGDAQGREEQRSGVRFESGSKLQKSQISGSIPCSSWKTSYFRILRSTQSARWNSDNSDSIYRHKIIKLHWASRPEHPQFHGYLMILSQMKYKRRWRKKELFLFAVHVRANARWSWKNHPPTLAHFLWIVFQLWVITVESQFFGFLIKQWKSSCAVRSPRNHEFVRIFWE